MFVCCSGVIINSNCNIVTQILNTLNLHYVILLKIYFPLCRIQNMEGRLRRNQQLVVRQKTVVRKILAYTITATGVETLKPEVQEEDI